MSDLGDFDRGRRRKKKIIKKVEKEHDVMAGRGPIILAKPPAERPATARASSAETVGQVQAPATHTSILRSREEDRSLSSPSLMVASTSTSTSSALFTNSAASTFIPLQSSAVVDVDAQPQSKIQIQQKTAASVTIAGSSSAFTASSASHSTDSKTSLTESGSLDARLAPYVEMKSSVKLIDEAMQFCDHTSEFLQDQSDFLVIGVLGLQGVGKSTILSLLSGRHDFQSSSKPSIFKFETKEHRESGEHCTRGIDIFVSNHRTILLDVQPMLSHSVLDHMIQFEKFPAEYGSTENALEIQSLQLAGFLMTVCHVVILVQDWFTDSNFLRFVQAAEMLRPSALLLGHDNGDNAGDHFPHLVFVQNKCSPSDFEPTKVKSIQETYSRIFDKSKLKFKAPIGIGLSNIALNLKSTTSEESVNLFLLPFCQDFGKKTSANTEFSTNKLMYRGSPSLEELAKSFRHQIHSMPRNQMLHTTLNEKNWFHYAARSWETIKKSGLYMEYCRLLS